MKSTYKIINGKYSYIKEFKNIKEQVHFIAYGLKAGMSMIKMPSLYKRIPIKRKTEANQVYKEGRA